MATKSEKKLRSLLSKAGYQLSKSRVKNSTLNNMGGYMITDTATKRVIAGNRYELQLGDVEIYARDLQR